MLEHISSHVEVSLEWSVSTFIFYQDSALHRFGSAQNTYTHMIYSTLHSSQLLSSVFSSVLILW